MPPKSDDQVYESLLTQRDNILRLIELVTSKPKPTYNIDNQQVEWAEYLKQLQASLTAVQKQIVMFNPFSEESVWYPGQ